MAATTATATTAFTACTDVGVLGRNGDDKDCVCFVCAAAAAAVAARRTSGGMVIAGPHCLIGMFFIAILLLRAVKGVKISKTTLSDWCLSIQLKLKKKDYSWNFQYKNRLKTGSDFCSASQYYLHSFICIMWICLKCINADFCKNSWSFLPVWGPKGAARHRRRLVAVAAAYCCCVAGRVAATDKPQLAQLSPVVWHIHNW